jgi:hypothetical protein
MSGAIASGQVGLTALADETRNNFAQSGSLSLASGTVQSGHLGDGSVVSGSIASGHIAWPHIADASILANHVGSGAINNFTKIASGTIRGQNVASGTLTTFNLGNFAVRSGGPLRPAASARSTLPPAR